MAKPVRFGGSTAFNFGANLTRPRKPGKGKAARRKPTGKGGGS